MIVIMRDAIMPDCCNTCVCSEGYGCGITGTIMTTKEMESRPDRCPLEEVEPCEDAVSREAVHTVIEEVLYETTKGADNWYGLLNDGVRTLPPVQPDFDITVKIDKAYDDGYKAGYLQAEHYWGDLYEGSD